ncbi:MAG: HypC/HybG/HupF family hydrogenase formation chaperone [Gammaproteobacteria bacterium]
MCLAVPGRIVAITDDDPLTRSGQVAFGGIEKAINLAFVPAAMVGDYVVVHAGFAISVLDRAAAARTLAALRELDGAALAALERGGPAS